MILFMKKNIKEEVNPLRISMEFRSLRKVQRTIPAKFNPIAIRYE